MRQAALAMWQEKFKANRGQSECPAASDGGGPNSPTIGPTAPIAS